MVSVRFAPAPPKTKLPLGTTVALEEFGSSVRLPAAVSKSLMVKLTFVAESSLIVRSATLEIVGASLMGSTVSRNELVPDCAPSLTTTNTVQAPLMLPAGVMVTVRLEPLPETTRLALDTRS